MRILAISGSLREFSANTTLLRAAGLLFPGEIEIYNGLTTLPYFNPDDEPGPDSVAEFRRRIVMSDGLIICSPEYAHGVPGVLKNALDWLVGSGELVEKPIALISANPRAAIANESLAETLRVMTGRLIPDACIALPVSGRKLTDAEIAADPTLAEPLKKAVEALVAVIRLT